MAKKRKWEIESLKKSKSLLLSAKTILNERIDVFLEAVIKYFEDSSVENLHDVRIAIRRVRYSMELFLVCFEKKLFLRFYDKIEQLQDLSGSVRDLDVLLENVKSLNQQGKIKSIPELNENVTLKKMELEENFKFDLMKFLHSKVFKDFTKALQ